jgi:hypothetical protein
MTTTISNPEVRSTDLLVHELLVQLRAAERAEERADAIKAELVERLGDGGKVETHEAKIAIVANKTQVVDIDALQTVASKGFFYKVTKRVVDNTAFKAFLALEQVPQDVLDIVTTKVSKPAVRVTIKK